MHIYVTPKCKKLIKEYKLEDKISKLEVKLSSPTLHKLFQPIGKYWRRNEGELRIIATSQQMNRESVLCLLHVFHTADSDYERFLDNPGVYEFEQSINESSLRAFLRKAAMSGRNKGKPVPSDMLPWLQPPAWGSTLKAGDWVVYETEEWVSRFRARSIQDDWSKFHEIILGIVTAPESGTEITELPGVRIGTKDNIYVVFSCTFQRQNSQLDNMKQTLLLMYPSIGEPVCDELVSLPTFRHINAEQQTTRGNEIPVISNVARYARRSYPGYILADRIAWLAIQREEEANLALSPEEEEILEIVSGRFPDKPTLPVFIKGRAGSAKSTMLYYLFADYCYRKIKDNLRGKLLFVTYNEKLVERARETVQKLLHSHYRFLETENDQRWVHQWKPFFSPLRNFF